MKFYCKNGCIVLTNDDLFITELTSNHFFLLYTNVVDTKSTPRLTQDIFITGIFDLGRGVGIKKATIRLLGLICRKRELKKKQFVFTHIS